MRACLKWLILSLVLSAPLTYANNIETLRTFLSGVQSWSGRFEQTVQKRNQQIEQREGRFSIVRPGRFRWEYRQPSPLIIVADGQRVFIYDVELKQVTVRSQSQALTATPAALFSQNNPIDNNFHLKDMGQTPDGMAWVELTPKQADTGYQSMQIALRNGEVTQLVLLDTFNQTTRISFVNTHKNTVAPEQFKFTPPAGVDVVREE